MKRRTTTRLAFLAILMAFLCTPASALAGPASKMKLQAQLIWGTNDEKPADPDLKPIDPKIAKKLEGLAIKWKNYYLVNTKEFSVNEGSTKLIEMSKDCELMVKNIDGTNVEVQLVGKGKPAGKVTKGLGKGKCLVTGGDATNSTAWFVFLKQVE
jgi:hypothetical protein